MKVSRSKSAGGKSRTHGAIKIKRPGALTKKAKAAGMGVQAYARKNAHAPGLTGKQARFALNAKKWRH